MPSLTIAAVLGLLGAVTMTTCWEVPDNFTDIYFGTISKEHSYALTETEGDIPAWIEGT
jgi:hypothetical protein